MIIFLDIDGVLNALGGKRSSDWPDAKKHEVLYDGQHIELWLSRELGDRLASLPATIVWVTTWQDEAWKVGDIVGINAAYLPLGKGWKLHAVGEYLGRAPAPFVWIDDYEVDDWSESTLRDVYPDLPMLLVSPASHSGITRSQLDDIERFVLDNQSTKD